MSEIGSTNDLKIAMTSNNNFRDPAIPNNVFLEINNQVIPIMRRETKLGRSLENDLVIQDVLVSRDHAKVVCEDGKFILYNLDSTGGSFINGTKCTRGELKSGDEISLATVKITFREESPDLETKADEKTGTLL
ncbi:MAG: FHA domain-containing protein [Chloroflexota bacterium]